MFILVFFTILMLVTTLIQTKTELEETQKRLLHYSNKNEEYLALNFSKQDTINRKNEVIEELENELIKMETVLLKPDVNLSVFRMQLKQQMKKHKLTVSGLSKKTKVSYNTIDKLLKTEGNTNLKSLRSIAEGVDHKLGTLIMVKN